MSSSPEETCQACWVIALNPFVLNSRSRGCPTVLRWRCNAPFNAEIIFTHDLHSVSNSSSEGASQVALVVKNLAASAGDVRDTGSIPSLGRSLGGGLGNPLQYSCLENRMDRGAWWATVHRVAKSLLKQLSTAHYVVAWIDWSDFTLTQSQPTNFYMYDVGREFQKMYHVLDTGFMEFFAINIRLLQNNSLF